MWIISWDAITFFFKSVSFTHRCTVGKTASHCLLDREVHNIQQKYSIEFSFDTFHVFFLSSITFLLLTSLFPPFKSGFVALVVQDSRQGQDKPVFELLVPLLVHSYKVNTLLILSVPQFPYLYKRNKMPS